MERSCMEGVRIMHVLLPLTEIQNYARLDYVKLGGPLMESYRTEHGLTTSPSPGKRHSTLTKLQAMQSGKPT